MRLRTRLVLWFVAAIVVTVLMSFTLGSQVWRLFYRDYDAAQDAHAAVVAWQQGGSEQLRHWLHERRREDGLFGMLLDEQGESLAGRGREGGPPPPPRLREAIAAAEAGNHLVLLPGGGTLRTTVVVSNDGRRLRWVAVLPPPGGPDVRRIDTLMLLAIGVIVVSLAAWLIARRITRPIAALQQASRAVAEGRLDVRVPEETSVRSDEIGALARDFNHMAERLQRLLEAQQQLLRDISHELRSPLARLRIATELARDTQAVSQFDRIELEADKLEDLIAQLLLIARLEHRETPLTSEVFALDEIVESVCEDAGFEAQARGIAVHSELTPGLQIRGQPTLLHSAIENVVRNAVRYTGDNSTVTVRLVARGTHCAVAVEDRGPGIPQDRLEAVFQPFVRISEARDRASGGYGLGLAIARRVVNASGGTIRARNREGGGLQVSIELPLANA
ncbi:ATP-binding protein [Solimonas terrae]|uniref:histidine kinase n=1 Tax=Solimonas terrae TaxID=1396819 RepID=A0A6M2BSG8_9GAMM|nr:ATP-binding protein [Solimonas terrae]NGY05572.1 HAMP domain-containing protein [Solimonas terrae]